ncbi:cell wall-binding repeat-containing protein [uncultured Fusobacterium sp.]|uniref:cell wall-binding repeat-containing protein n=1 Tax=uncultured Fusobacterium sp. TaxID=159267 RepID=UPI0025FD10F3|nr:cell wall-binding repeat-containing protein [uncultured Fusobacterium sp.]
MNKKKLSVVMAGAMLASSVAPVLAATESKVDQNELGSLVEKVYNKVTETLYTSNGHSVYGVKVNDVDVAVDELAEDLKDSTKKRALFQKLQEEFKGLTAGQKVVIYSKGFTTDEDGKIVEKENVVKKYTEDDFVKNATTTKEAIINALANDDNATLTDGTVNKNLIADEKQVVSDTAAKTMTIYFNEHIGMELPKVTNPGGTVPVGTYKKLVLKAEDHVLDFKHVDTKDGHVYEIDGTTPGAKGANVNGTTIKCTVEDIAKFPVVMEKTDIPEKDIEEITITGEENNFKTEDLYDGLMLTTEGHDFLSLIKAASKKTGYKVVFKHLNGNNIENATTELESTKGEYGFVVEIINKTGKTTKYTVKGEKASTQTVFNWMYSRLAKVDILAGDNRYETAVSVAREQLGMSKDLVGANDTTPTITPSHIVLVNGKSLVDGLAAAPLAATLDANPNVASNQAAPMLLTEADALPKATKSFLKELLADKKIGDVNTTIHLVGGTSVLSRELEKELRSYGFKIERYNGANREETSLEVAEAIEKVNQAPIDGRFVVGAEGEADAMSIAPVAAHGKTPIIVAKKGGISYQAIDELEEKDVTVVGGEASISKEDYEAIEESTGENGSIERVAGENRQATNAAIIKKYYYSANEVANGLRVNSVIVTKDGRGNKDELVDALTVANFAVQEKAPIVLAKDSLSKEQKDALLLRAKNSETLYQVGHGVSRDNIMAPIAKLLGLSNLK